VAIQTHCNLKAARSRASRSGAGSNYEAQSVDGVDPLPTLDGTSTSPTSSPFPFAFPSFPFSVPYSLVHKTASAYPPPVGKAYEKGISKSSLHGCMGEGSPVSSCHQTHFVHFSSNIPHLVKLIKSRFVQQ